MWKYQENLSRVKYKNEILGEKQAGLAASAALIVSVTGHHRHLAKRLALLFLILLRTVSSGYDQLEPQAAIKQA